MGRWGWAEGAMWLHHAAAAGADGLEGGARALTTGSGER
jgi:hypothetical protein